MDPMLSHDTKIIRKIAVSWHIEDIMYLEPSFDVTSVQPRLLAQTTCTQALPTAGFMYVLILHALRVTHSDGLQVYSLDGRIVQVLDRGRSLPISYDPSEPDPGEPLPGRYAGPVCVRDVSWHSQVHTPFTCNSRAEIFMLFYLKTLAGARPYECWLGKRPWP